MIIYNLTYHRDDTNITETRKVRDNSIKSAIKRMIETASSKGVKLSRMVVTEDGTGTHLRVCDLCQSIRWVIKHKCNECKIGGNNG